MLKYLSAVTPVSDKNYLLKFQPQTGEGNTLDYSYVQSGQEGYAQYAQVSSGSCALTSPYRIL